jgi:NodT family efflux transporter outer membrane factor (OMF) lipoprotein
VQNLASRRSFPCCSLILRWVSAGLLLSTGVASFAGCAVGPDFDIPSAPNVGSLTPQRLRIPGAAAGETQRYVGDLDIPGDWWALFHSRPLNDLIERALRDNNDLQAAQAALRIARANVEAQRGFFFPTVEASYAPSRQQVASSVLIPSTPGATPFYTLQTAQLAVGYVPDVFGGNRRQVETLEAQSDAQRFQLEATYLTLTSNLAIAAVQEASLRGQIQATKHIISIQEELLALLKRQFGLGQVGKIDVATQEAALAQVQQTLPLLEKQLAQQRDFMIALTGHLAGEGLPERFEFSSLRLPGDLPVSLPSALVEQRPDVRAAEANLHAASAQVGVSIANRFPQFSLVGTNVGRQSASFADLFLCGATCTLWTIAGSATQVVFDGFTLEQKQRAAEAGLDQAAAQYRTTVVTGFQNVADALQALEADARALRAAVASERASEKTLKLTQAQLRLGQVSSLQVLNAQQTYLQALLNAVQAKTSRYADTVALFQALGGGWWNRSDVNADRNGGWWTHVDVVVSDRLVTEADYATQK